MFRRTFVVVGIVECLQPGRGGWELIDSHGAGTVVCPITTGSEVGTETIHIYIYMYICIYIYNNNNNNCVFGSLLSDVTCNFVSADGEGMACGGLPFSGTGCPIPDVDNLCLLCIDLCLDAVSILTTSLGCFCPWTFRITDWTSCHGPHIYMLY